MFSLSRSRTYYYQRHIATAPQLPLQLNWQAMFDMLGKDHKRGEVIWNANTRIECRDALLKEMAMFREDKVLCYVYA